MSRYVKPYFKNHTFENSDFVSLADLIGTNFVNAIEARNPTGGLQVRSSSDPTQIDDYTQNEIFKLNQETLRPGIKGFDVSQLEIAGNAGETVKIEFHT